MLILGIESSCDETAMAVVRDGREVLSSEIAGQHEFHEVFGGVVPEIAARRHQQVIQPLYELALRNASVSISEIDAIAVTNGPGLIGAILVGASFAKGLALASGKPLIPVNHVHAHVHGALLGVDIPSEEIYPCLALVVSGGHTNLYYLESPLDFQLLAVTVDDACGEAFDKVGKLLHLPYPGGPQIEKAARSGDRARFKFPKIIGSKDSLAFSYSGLKTHVAQLVRNSTREQLDDPQFVADICAAFQDEALSQIVRRIDDALVLKPDIRTILVSGGVSANLRFRELMASVSKVPVYFPKLSYCSDNAAMIAAMGYHLFEKNSASYVDTSLGWESFTRSREKVVVI